VLRAQHAQAIRAANAGAGLPQPPPERPTSVMANKGPLVLASEICRCDSPPWVGRLCPAQVDQKHATCRR